MTRLRQIKAFLDRHIDYRGAIAGAAVLGSIVLYVNLDHGWGPAPARTRRAQRLESSL